MVGMIHKDLVFTPFEKAIKHNLDINMNLLRLAEILSAN
jgi:6-phosphofructokinase 1